MIAYQPQNRQHIHSNFPHLILANPPQGGDMVTEIKTTPKT
ncbi:MAG: Uma2 family endonuclease, partial [Arthrospira sp. PLM2.Bin9]